MMKKADTKFKPGQSGNPRGRPAGSRNKATLAVEALLEKDARKLTRKAVELAIAGDTTALRICMERICPPRKGVPVRFDLPTMTNSGDVRAAALAVLQAVSEGNISPEEGGAVVPIIEIARRSIETDELNTRLEALEAALGRRAKP